MPKQPWFAPLLAAPGLTFAAAGLLLPLATAQTSCVDWNAREGFVTMNGLVAAMTVWDRDGSGPLPPLWVFGGQFTAVGNVIANRIATFDPASSTWAPLGSGMTNTLWGGPYVTALATLPNGDLIAGGTFAEAGGQYAADGVARWDGTNWGRLGYGIPGRVATLAVMPNGDLIVGGDFTVTGTTIARIARWNGTAWSALGSGVNFAPTAMTVAPNGDLIAAGTVVGATGQTQISRWDGTTWTPLGPAFPGSVNSLLHLPNGTLVLGGGLQFGPIAYGAMSWNGSNWSPFGGLQTSTRRLALLGNGDLLAMTNQPRRWNGSAWTPVAPAIEGTLLQVLPNDELILYGRSDSSYSSPYRLYRTSGGPWQAFGRGLDGYISQLAVASNGDILAVGGFTLLPSGIQNLARWNGSTWSSLAPVVPTSIAAVLGRGNGRIVVAADFAQILGPGHRIAEWGGAAWSPLGSYWSSVSATAELPTGDLLAAGSVAGVSGGIIARWDGLTWQPLGSSLNEAPSLLTPLADGSVVAVGSNLQGVASAIRWDGSSWTVFGAGILNPSSRLLVRADGSLLASSGNSVFHYQGGAWPAVGAPQLHSIRDLLELPNGDVLIGLSISGYQQQSLLRRWNGATWLEVGPILNGNNYDSSIYRLAQPRAGEVVVAGNFSRVAGLVANGFVRMQSTCPATSTPLGAGCAASGALASLAPTALPWLGSTFRAQASNLPPSGIAVIVTGFAPISLPLGSLLPPSPVGCNLWVSPEAIELAAMTAGSLVTTLAIPNQPALIGVVVHRQVVAIELDAQAAPVQSLATNALTLTVGAF